MAYLPPQVLVTEDFIPAPISSTLSQPALIIGPQYSLARYGVSTEKINTIVNDPTYGQAYQSGSDIAYAYPGKASLSVADQAYVGMFMENVQAQYFPNSTLGGGSGVATRQSPTTTTNAITIDSLVFKTGNGGNRDAVLSNRDVQIGDYVALTDGSHSLTTKVKAILPGAGTSSTIAVLAVAPADSAGNDLIFNYFYNEVTAATASFPVSEAHAASPVHVGGTGSVTNVSIANTSTHYYGHNDLGVVSDVYTIIVTFAGTLSTALFSISSKNGVFATKVNQPLVANVLSIDTGGSNVVQVDFTGTTAGNFTLATAWTIPVTAAVSEVTPTITGTYTGTVDRVYKLVVSRGGLLYDGSTNAATCAQVTITSDNIDSSPVVNVQSATAFSVGTLGAKVSLTASNHGGLIAGNVYYVKASAAVAGTYTILQLNDVVGTANSVLTGSLTAKLLLPQTGISVPAIRSLIGGTLNFVPGATTVTVKSGLTVTDPLLVDNTSAVVPLSVLVGNVFIQHRDLLQDNVNAFSSISDASTVASILGPVDPDNPLAQGVYNAALNSQGSPVYYLGISTNDLTGYNKALAIAAKTRVVYALVPLTFDKTIRDAFAAHADTYSTPVKAKRRTTLLSLQLVSSAVIADNITGTVADDPSTGGTQYTLVSSSGATFITTAVRAGDVLFINFRLDPTGATIYDQYTIASVLTQTTLLLTTGLPTAINSPTKIQVSRNYTVAEQVTNYITGAAQYKDHRVGLVFPDAYTSGANTLPGYFLSCMVAGYGSGVVPQQGLTNANLLGITNLPAVVNTFTEDQLNLLAAQGVMIITQDVLGGLSYIRHQLTSDNSSLNLSEYSITRNVDSVANQFQDVLDPFKGKYNANPGTILLMRAAMDGVKQNLLLNTDNLPIGPQLNSCSLDSITQDAVSKDKINARVICGFPSPINKVAVDLVVT